MTTKALKPCKLCGELPKLKKCLTGWHLTHMCHEGTADSLISKTEERTIGIWNAWNTRTPEAKS